MPLGWAITRGGKGDVDHLIPAGGDPALAEAGVEGDSDLSALDLKRPALVMAVEANDVAQASGLIQVAELHVRAGGRERVAPVGNLLKLALRFLHRARLGPIHEVRQRNRPGRDHHVLSRNGFAPDSPPPTLPPVRPADEHLEQEQNGKERGNRIADSLVPVSGARPFDADGSPSEESCQKHIGRLGCHRNGGCHHEPHEEEQVDDREQVPAEFDAPTAGPKKLVEAEVRKTKPEKISDPTVGYTAVIDGTEAEPCQELIRLQSMIHGECRHHEDRDDIKPAAFRLVEVDAERHQKTEGQQRNDIDPPKHIADPVEKIRDDTSVEEKEPVRKIDGLVAVAGVCPRVWCGSRHDEISLNLRC